MIEVKVLGKEIPRCVLTKDDDTIFSKLHLYPYPHQLKSYEFLVSEEKTTKIIFNTCGTGLGKTYSAVLPLLDLEETYSVFIYPTNALIDDQYSTILSLIKKAGYDERTVFKATARELVKHSKRRNIDRRGLLEDFLSSTYSNLKILVTNPDLFYIALALRFSRKYAVKIAVPLIQRFNTVIFDEFHLYDWKQLSNILFFMRLFSEFNENSKFVFLSATPSSEFINEVKRIFENAEIKVVSEKDDTECEKISYKVVADIHLEIHKYDDVFQWFLTNIDHIKSFIKENLSLLENDKDSKIVIILNSVYNAQQIKELLEENLKDLPITIGAWHGLNRYTRTIEKDSNIIVGTSAIEVGIDFKAVLLIFEADNAASFIQRFGRVGRVAGKPEWSNLKFKAIALVPTYVYNYLSRVLNDVEKISRDELSKMIYNAYEERTKFKNYMNKYAPIEHYGISTKYILNTYNPEDRKKLQHVFEKTIQEVHPNINLLKVKDAFEQYSSMSNLLDELYQFRGGLFDVPIYDETLHKQGQFPFNIYNLFYCLNHFDFSVISYSEFMEHANMIDRESDAYKTFEFELNQILKYDPDIPFIHIISRKPKYPLKVSIYNDNDLLVEEVEISSNFTLKPNYKIYDTQKLETLQKLNNWLRHKKLVYLLAEKNIYSLRNKLKLSPYFPLHTFTGSTIYGDLNNGSITFGLYAFLLDSELNK